MGWRKTENDFLASEESQILKDLASSLLHRGPIIKSGVATAERNPRISRNKMKNERASEGLSATSARAHLP